MSELKVNKISPKTACGTTTLGDSGDTFNIPAGVTITNNGTQTGFGRTGTVDWQTTPKTATFTAVSGEGYFCNTSGGAFEVDLPAGSAGAIVSVQDYNNTFDSNSLTIDPNGSEKINGGDAGVALELSTEGQGLTLVYVDSTIGWRSIHSDDFSQVPQTATFMTATGGTITTVCTNYKVHTFTGPGTFTVCSVGNCAGSNTVSYTVVAGGGAGGRGATNSGAGGGGGGAGGYREGRTPQCNSCTVSPLNAPAGLPVSATSYPITVGAGGAAASLNTYGTETPSASGNGNNSVFSSITSTAGGGGANRSTPTPQGGASGGSGGGSRACVPAEGLGNQPPVSPPQGNNGGAGGPNGTNGGGGGATAVGTSGNGSAQGPGGAGATNSINGTPTARAGGGGAGGESSTPAGANGGAGGGGDGSDDDAGNAVAGTTNTGGGGGGGAGSSPGSVGKNGGSGIVMIRYRFQ